MLPNVSNKDVFDRSTLDELMSRLKDGEPLLKRLFAIYQEETPRLLAELQKGMESRNEEEVYDAIHQLKGSSAAMGATRVFGITDVALGLCKDGSILEIENLVEVIQTEASLYIRDLSLYLAT